MQDVFIAKLLAVERTTSVSHKDRWYRPLCNAQFCVKKTIVEDEGEDFENVLCRF